MMKTTITLFFTLFLLFAFLNPLAGSAQNQLSEDGEHEEEHSHTNDESHADESHDDEEAHDHSDVDPHDEEEAHDHSDIDPHDVEEAHDHSDDEAVTEIGSEMAEQVGIQTARSAPQLLHQKIQTFGRLMTGAEQTSHVRARFPGMIESVDVSIGDEVEEGDLLAVVESNDSLKTYEVTAPINGTIFQRHANVGEMTQEQILFSISNFDTLWAELRVFPTQQKDVKVGQPIYIKLNDQSVETAVSHLLPSGDNANYFVARAKLEGSENGFFKGQMIEGQIVVSDFEAAVAVENMSIQSMETQLGVFIKNGDEYRFVPLVLGRTDGVFTEVLSGIDSGIEYVTNNSYLIKADIEKSEAEHEH